MENPVHFDSGSSGDFGRHSDRRANRSAVVIPGGRLGVCVAAGLGLVVVAVGIVLSFVPPGDSSSKLLFETKLVAGTVLSVLLGLILYYRGAREKSARAND